jgi:asparagine synthase (glutamine-hydrolysing)
MAFIWDGNDPAATAWASRLGNALHADGGDWLIVLQLPGLQLHCRGFGSVPDRAYLLGDGHGAVVGRVFRQPRLDEPLAAEAELDDRCTGAMFGGEGRHLIDDYWGRYVAFLYDRRLGCTSVLRDPSGGLLCLRSRIGGVDLVFNRLADYERATGNHASPINWRHVAGFLAYGCLPATDTGLDGVTPIGAGELVRFTQGDSRSRYCWNPLAIAASDTVEDPRHAAHLLRGTIIACTRAWSSAFPGVLLKLSGGLDSAIVLACLRASCGAHQVTAINHHSEGSNSDERHFARDLAGHFGITLIEWHRDPAWNWRPLLRIPRCPFPFSYFGFAQYGRPYAALADQQAAGAVFSGNGGDLVFFRHASHFPATDYAHAHGLGPGYMRAALDAAELDRISIWSAFGATIRRILLKHPQPLLPDPAGHVTLMPAEAIESVRRDGNNLHPMYRTVNDVAPGKAWQAYMTTFSLSPYYDPFEQPGDPVAIAPLLSQPVIELCLRIPSYVHAGNARDRNVARCAFAADLPRTIVTRRAKGGMEEHTKLALKYNLKLVRELLQDGALVRHGLLDRRKLEAVLSGRPERIDTTAVELYRYVNAEAWLLGAGGT